VSLLDVLMYRTFKDLGLKLLRREHEEG